MFNLKGQQQNKRDKVETREREGEIERQNQNPKLKYQAVT